MFKLCIALAFVAVAAAKPNWPLPYSGIDEFAYPYPVGAYPHGYTAPLVKSVVAPAPIVKTVAPVGFPAPVVKTVAPLGYPEVAPIAPVAPVAPLAPVAPFAPIGYHSGLAADSYLNYNTGFPFIVKK